MAHAFVQYAQGTLGAAGTAIAVAFNSSNTAGSIIFAQASWFGAVTCTVADSNLNTWSNLPQLDNGTSHTQLFYSFNCAAGANTVTFTFSGAGATYSGNCIAEYSGGANALDQHAESSGTGTAVDSGNVTTTTNNQLWIAYGEAATNLVFSPGTGWTLRSTGNRFTGFEDQLNKAIATVAGKFTLNTSSNWVVGIATFYVSASPPVVGTGNVTHQQLRKLRG